MESNDANLQLDTYDDINLLLNVLDDPVFRNLVKIQESLNELNCEIQQHPSILPRDFDISTSGELVLNVPPNSAVFDYPDEQRVPSAQISPRSLNSPPGYGVSDENQLLSIDGHAIDKQGISIFKNSHGDVVELVIPRENTEEDERPQSVISNSSKHANDLMSSEWAEVQAIDLVNDGTGLGFGECFLVTNLLMYTIWLNKHEIGNSFSILGIIGAKSSGVIVKTILPGGVADRDERLLSGDHILQIGEVNLHEMVSEQVASVLRQSGTHVRLVVARPIDPMQMHQNMEGSAIIPSHLLADPQELQRYLTEAGYPDIFGVSSTVSTPSVQTDQFFKDESNLISLDLPETERFVVELTKDFNGLGVTIAGYVCEKEELSGIFIKSVSPGSAADLSGRIHVNDRIIQVDGQSLHGFSNHQVDALTINFELKFKSVLFYRRLMF